MRDDTAQFARQPQEEREELVPDDGGFDICPFEVLYIGSKPTDVVHGRAEQGSAWLGNGRPLRKGELMHVDIGAGH